MRRMAVRGKNRETEMDSGDLATHPRGRKFIAAGIYRHYPPRQKIEWVLCIYKIMEQQPVACHHVRPVSLDGENPFFRFRSREGSVMA